MAKDKPKIARPCERCGYPSDDLQDTWICHNPDIHWNACPECRLDLIHFMASVQGHPELTDDKKQYKQNGLLFRREISEICTCPNCGNRHDNPIQRSV